MAKRIRLGTVLGFPIQVDASWIIVFLWVTWSLGVSYYPQVYPEWSTAGRWAMAALTSALFFVSVILHELGHSVVARHQGVPVKDITLYIFGGVAQISEEPRSAKNEVFMALAGPAVSLTLGVVLVIVWLATQGVVEPVSAMAMYVGLSNLSLGLFNLIPGFPLDGGRVLRAVLWAARDDLMWATRWASRVGQVVSYLFTLGGIGMAMTGAWGTGLSLVLVGMFLQTAAKSSYAQLTVRTMLADHIVAEAMSDVCSTVPPQVTLDMLVEHYIVQGGQRCFAVSGPDGPVGLLTVHRVSDVPRDKWRDTHVRDVMMALEDTESVSPETDLEEAMRHMTSDGVNQLPVLRDGKLVGMLTREDLVTFIRERMRREREGRAV
ncbi:MAG: M50 family metallopeptidase [Anaerolineae bacterium]